MVSWFGGKGTQELQSTRAPVRGGDVDQWEWVGLTQPHQQRGQPVTVALALRIESEIGLGILLFTNLIFTVASAVYSYCWVKSAIITNVSGGCGSHQCARPENKREKQQTPHVHKHVAIIVRCAGPTYNTFAK